MIVMLFVAQLLITSPAVAGELASAGNARCRILAVDEKVVVSVRSFDPRPPFASAVARIKTVFDEAVERITISLRGVRMAVGRVMRSFTVFMLGSRAFGTARPFNLSSTGPAGRGHNPDLEMMGGYVGWSFSL